jgi:hypothetical protein
MAVYKKAFFNRLQFLLLRVNNGNIGVASLAHFDCRPCAACDDLYFDPGLLLKERQDIAEQT